MEEKEEIQKPYYEMSYLDDDNTMHIAKIANKESLDFYEQRFTILKLCYINF